MAGLATTAAATRAAAPRRPHRAACRHCGNPRIPAAAQDRAQPPKASRRLAPGPRHQTDCSNPRVIASSDGPITRVPVENAGQGPARPWKPALPRLTGKQIQSLTALLVTVGVTQVEPMRLVRLRPPGPERESRQRMSREQPPPAAPLPPQLLTSRPRAPLRALEAAEKPIFRTRLDAPRSGVTHAGTKTATRVRQLPDACNEVSQLAARNLEPTRPGVP